MYSTCMTTVCVDSIRLQKITDKDSIIVIKHQYTYILYCMWIHVQCTCTWHQYPRMSTPYHYQVTPNIVIQSYLTVTRLHSSIHREDSERVYISKQCVENTRRIYEYSSHTHSVTLYTVLFCDPNRDNLKGSV